MKHSVRNSNNGRFTKAENTFKGIEVNQDKKYQPIPVVQIFIAMIIIFGALVALDYLGVISIVKSGE